MSTPKPDWYDRTCKSCGKPCADHAKEINGRWYFYLCRQWVKLPETCEKCGESIDDLLRWTEPKINVLGRSLHSPIIDPTVACEEPCCPWLEPVDDD